MIKILVQFQFVQNISSICISTIFSNRAILGKGCTYLELCCHLYFQLQNAITTAWHQAVRDKKKLIYTYNYKTIYLYTILYKYIYATAIIFEILYSDKR